LRPTQMRQSRLIVCARNRPPITKKSAIRNGLAGTTTAAASPVRRAHCRRSRSNASSLPLYGVRHLRPSTGLRTPGSRWTSFPDLRHAARGLACVATAVSSAGISVRLQLRNRRWSPPECGQMRLAVQPRCSLSASVMRSSKLLNCEKMRHSHSLIPARTTSDMLVGGTSRKRDSEKPGSSIF
jgi:hypothetical protein